MKQLKTMIENISLGGGSTCPKNVITDLYFAKKTGRRSQQNGGGST